MALEQVLARLEPIIDPRVGVVTAVNRLELPPGAPSQMVAYAATVGRPTALHPGGCRVPNVLGAVQGYGTAVDDGLARVRAVCEALERYCSMMYPCRSVITATASALGDSALDLGALPQCSEAERRRLAPRLRLRRPLPNDSHQWVEGVSLLDGRTVHVPLDVAYMGLPRARSEILQLPISTGFAAGSTYEQAALSATCEVIERDSLALWWLHQLPLPRLHESIVETPAVAELLERATRAGVTTHFFDLTTDLGVPVVGGIQLCQAWRPHVVAMAACRPSPVDAAVRVLEELAGLRLALFRPESVVDRSAFDSGHSLPPDSFGAVYAHPDGAREFAFALASPVADRPPPTLTNSSALRRVLQRLHANGAHPILVDVTLPEIRDVGLVVVRVVIPELMPITFCHRIRYLAHPRLYTAPAAMGYGHRTEREITDAPIPFA